jgi:hypothetical protein
MATYEVFKVENRTGGHEEHVGQVDADNQTAALEVAIQKHRRNCRETEHIEVRDPAD